MESKTNYEIKRKINKSHLFHTLSDIVEHVDSIINNKLANDPVVLVESKMLFAVEHAKWNQEGFEVSNIQSQVLL